MAEEREKERIESIDEYFVLLIEYEQLLGSHSEPARAGRLELLERLLDSFEKEMFPIGKGSSRSGGRF